MNLLENELVGKYFGTDHKGCPEGCMYPHLEAESERILKAMQEPIRKGEKYLNFANQSDWILMEDCPREINGFHPWDLRLPDRFQGKRNAVEDKIRSISGLPSDKQWIIYDRKDLEKELRELNALFRDPEKCICELLKNMLVIDKEMGVNSHGDCPKHGRIDIQ